jgi:hypothetical protein
MDLSASDMVDLMRIHREIQQDAEDGPSVAGRQFLEQFLENNQVVVHLNPVFLATVRKSIESTEAKSPSATS